MKPNYSMESFPYALGYWQGMNYGNFDNDTYQKLSELDKHLYKTGYESGVANYSEIDTEKKNA